MNLHMVEDKAMDSTLIMFASTWHRVLIALCLPASAYLNRGEDHVQILKKENKLAAIIVKIPSYSAGFPLSLLSVYICNVCTITSGSTYFLP
uniref:Uncharacterized protein n=1 Tax=Arundo donax TaxID=35708 RepID=A0A0A8YIH0_ARUDO